MREAAFALGLPAWRVTSRILYKAALSGIVTGVLLGLARIAGETAPLLFTALNNQFWSASLDQPLANVPVVIFQYAMSPYDEWHALAWAGALSSPIFVLGPEPRGALLRAQGEQMIERSRTPRATKPSAVRSYRPRSTCAASISSMARRARSSASTWRSRPTQ